MYGNLGLLHGRLDQLCFILKFCLKKTIITCKKNQNNVMFHGLIITKNTFLMYGI